MAEFGLGWEKFLPPYACSLRKDALAGFGGETVCITGAGGSIGSSLAEALAAGKLARLILLDSSEQRLFDMQRCLEGKLAARCEFVLGSVADRGLLSELFGRFQPQIVIHAAAFKHVALLEHNPLAAIENNVLGTYNLARSAFDHGVSRFVLLSTDKAVNPHSIMGVSKRLAELVTVSLSNPGFRASVIRLVNVIGSTGSVVPIFLQQIAAGEAVSVTDTRASRYFLTEKEAMAAILAIARAGCDGLVAVPKLSDPVLIIELAEFLIGAMRPQGKLSITISGLRPGEKMTEELTSEREMPAGTLNGDLSLFNQTRLDAKQLEEAIKQLSGCIARRDQAQLLQLLRQLVPEYVPSHVVEGEAALLSRAG